MSAFERPKSAWKSRSRTPHYTNWERDPDSGPTVSLESPSPSVSDSKMVARRETVLPSDASGSLSGRHTRAAEASREGKAGKQRRPPETKAETSSKVIDSERVTKENGCQKKKTQDSLDPTKKSVDVSRSQEETFRRKCASVSSVEEESRRLPNSTQKREKSWYDASDNKWLRDDPTCNARIMNKELREGRGGDGSVAAQTRRPELTVKPSKLAPLNISRQCDGVMMKETPDVKPGSWMPGERRAGQGLIPGVDMMGKRSSDPNRKNKLTPLPALRKCVDDTG